MAVQHLEDAGFPASGPWSEWIDCDHDGEPDDVAAWLSRLDEELPDRIAQCREEDERLRSLWQHMLPRLGRCLPHEVAAMLDAQLEAASRRGAAEALATLVRAERVRLAALRPVAMTAVDDIILRRLLDGITQDRSATGRACSAEVLETLCAVVLDLEATERRVDADNGQISLALAELRSHVATAAATLRTLPGASITSTPAGRPSELVSRALTAYSATLETRLEWRGGEPRSAESSAALLWVIDELLHQLHGSTAGVASVTVTCDDSGVRALISTPSDSLRAGDEDPDWLLRCRLRVRLAAGEVLAVPSRHGTCVEVRLP